MQTKKFEEPEHYALLIGIDCYLPNMLPDGSYYKSLGGCVRDVEHIETMLHRTLNLPKENITKLTATNTSSQKPLEPKERWPTYQKLVGAFKELTAKARSGDHVYIHYAGHGGRAATIFPNLKGANGYDEALVPTDMGNSEARYLRDVELVKLLKDMVDKGLIVAVVLDSCHSGGMTRGVGDVGVRGISTIDTTLRPTESLVGSHEDLSKVWEGLTGGQTREVKVGSGWLPEPKGYVLLAACRPSESAYEFAFNGRERNGALTYWLLDALKDLGPGLSYKMLHDRIITKVHSQFENQTPQLQGEGDRLVFGSDRIQPFYAVPVMLVDETHSRVLLNAGQAHGLREGAQFAVYPHGTADFTEINKRQALVEVADVGATDSWARVIKEFQPGSLSQGSQAVLLGAGAVRLIRKVSLVSRNELKQPIDQQSALQAIKQALEGNGRIEVAEVGDPIAYQVAINDQGEYEIWDRTGQPITNLRPSVKVTDSNAAAIVASRLVHVAKYHNLEQLDNNDPTSPLARKLVVEIIGKRSKYDPADRFEPDPFVMPGNTPEVDVGQWTGMRIINKSSKILNVTVFDLQPDWGATQIYPTGAGDNFVAFDPGQEVVLPLRADLPGDYSEGKDVLKVFATIGTTNFRWLELPPLDMPNTRSAAFKRSGDALEEIFVALTSERPKTRNFVVAAYPSREWVTAQVEMRIHRTPK